MHPSDPIAPSPSQTGPGTREFALWAFDYALSTDRMDDAPGLLTDWMSLLDEPGTADTLPNAD